MFTQELLRREAKRRIAWAQRLDEDFPTVDRPCAVAVVSAFDPAVFVESGFAFASGLPAEVRNRWCASFTRTVYLAGQPENIAIRYPPDHVSADGTIAWYRPDDLGAVTGLRKLLRPLFATTGVSRTTRAVASLNARNADTAMATLAVDSAGLTLEQYLVHVNHVVAEAVSMGMLDNRGFLRLVSVDRIDAARGPYDYLRVAADRHDQELLRCYAALKL
ncbi:DUF6182 family protein [Nocardia sp. NPDC051052]|uniref:DUF6182 family protein n=1 Tax=Nocardia sp. NPDC051052 TaxID=3364322 RepID=UPI0037929809